MFNTVVVDFPSADLWRSLRYFGLYRLILASFFIILSGVHDAVRLLGVSDEKLFLAGSIIYAGTVLFSLALLKFRWPRFTWQLAIQVGGDIAGLSVLSYASGGIQSSISLLLLISLAAAGLISRGRITLFFAALATIATLLEHTFAVLYDDASVAQYIQVGLLCVAYFAVAWLAHTLAKYAVDSQQLAQRRGRDLVSMSEANRLVMRDMQDGVLVVDEQGIIMQMNPSASALLRHSALSGSSLAESFPLLYGQYAMWKMSGTSSRNTLQLDVGVQARLRFVAVERNAAHGAVIFLEDMQRVQAEAQQIKLAALGRLTANIAHEVRNPLSAISYATELLQEERADTKQQRLLQIILDNTQRINQIVQDVMQLNRRDRAQIEVLDLTLALQNFVDEFTRSEHLAAGTLTLTGLPAQKIQFDRGHLLQILWNLCSNGLRHGSRTQGSLKLISGRVNAQVILDVQDDGPGISEPQRARLFEPFFTTAENGTGLGLYIAKELCAANGALLEYHAQAESGGACFRITFGEWHE